MTADTLATIRLVAFGLAGAVCAAYCLLAIIGDTPQPFSPWAPGISGALAGLSMWLSASAAGRKAASIAHDELYRLEWGRAVKFAYWFAIALYPVFAILLVNEVISFRTSFAAMGTATGAAPMLAFCAITLRG